MRTIFNYFDFFYSIIYLLNKNYNDYRQEKWKRNYQYFAKTLNI